MKALREAHAAAAAKLRAECTDDLVANVHARIGNGVRVSSPNVRRAGVNERDLYIMEAAGLARLEGFFTLGSQVTNTWLILF